MSQDALNKDSDVGPTDQANDHRPNQRLSCPSCKATNFPNLSKLNKHRNSHDKPYECSTLGCSERFAQQQNLDRHTQSKHGDTKNPTKFYHCTVDGCKYSSTGRRRKRFARADQVKEHIKDFGHYGPHSANDRPKRPGQPLFAEHIIIAQFEEWILDENALPWRTVQSYEYNSLKTKLWHTDATGGLYLRAGSIGDLESASYVECSIANCYYQLRPPESLDGTVFMTQEGLQEHRRRAHLVQGHPYSSTSLNLLPVPLSETRGSTSSLASMGSSTLLVEDVPSDLGTEFLTPNSQFVDGIDWAFDDVFGGDLFNKNQRDATEPQQPNPSDSFRSVGGTSQIQFSSISTSVDSIDLQSSISISEHFDEGNLMVSAPNISSSLTSNEPMLSLDSRISCELPGCNQNFRRKGDMKRHVESVHRMSTGFTCSLCERQFHRKDKVYAHLKNAHKVQPDSEFTKAKSLFTESSDSYKVDTVSVDALATVASPEIPWTEMSIDSFPSTSFESPYSWQGVEDDPANIEHEFL